MSRIVDEYGNIAWLVDGKRHRIDGPAIERIDGTKCWFVNGKLHRLDGPAYIALNKGMVWYINGERHRIDGPAVINLILGTQYWFINGENITEDAIVWVEENNLTIPFDEPTQMLFLMKFG